MKKEDPGLKQVKKAVRGNVKAYEQLILQYKEYLYRTAFLHLKNEEAALDAVQDCILNAWEKIGTLKKPEYFKTWLTRILLNCTTDILRSRSLEPLPDYMEVPKDEPTVSLEEKWDLYEAIDGLSDVYRSVIILKYFDGLKVNEISYAMDIPEGSVKAYLSRARKELRTYLEGGYLYAE